MIHTTNDQFARLAMTSQYIRLHRFDTRCYPFNYHVPDEAHKHARQTRNA